MKKWIFALTITVIVAILLAFFLRKRPALTPKVSELPITTEEPTEEEIQTIEPPNLIIEKDGRKFLTDKEGRILSVPENYFQNFSLTPEQ